MKDIPALLLAELRTETPTTALLWTIRKNDGTFIRGTSHDANIPIEGSGDSPPEEWAGLYLAQSNISGSRVRSSSDLAVDNLEVTGAIPKAPPVASPPESHTIEDISVRDIEAGLLDYAEVTVYLCSWKHPEYGIAVVKRGTLGEIHRDSDFRYSTEIRGLSQSLSQVFVRTYGERCQVDDFGDAECKVHLVDITESFTVTAVTSRRRFNATITGGPHDPGYFAIGNVTFVTGANASIKREVRKDDVDDISGHLATWDIFPDEIQIGDTGIIVPGCDRRASTCKDKYSNLNNFRGYGIFIEGMDALMKGPT